MFDLFSMVIMWFLMLTMGGLSFGMFSGHHDGDHH